MGLNCINAVIVLQFFFQNLTWYLLTDIYSIKCSSLNFCLAMFMWCQYNLTLQGLVPFWYRIGTWSLLWWCWSICRHSDDSKFRHVSWQFLWLPMANYEFFRPSDVFQYGRWVLTKYCSAMRAILCHAEAGYDHVNLVNIIAFCTILRPVIFL